MWPFKRRQRYPLASELDDADRKIMRDIVADKPRAYATHRIWAGAGTISRALDGIAEDVKNEAHRHCRIGKITMKG